MSSILSSILSWNTFEVQFGQVDQIKPRWVSCVDEKKRQCNKYWNERTTEELKIEGSVIGKLIGVRGRIVKDLRLKYKDSIIKISDKIKDGNRTVIITGTRKETNIIKNEIDYLIKS